MNTSSDPTETLQTARGYYDHSALKSLFDTSGDVAAIAYGESRTTRVVERVLQMARASRTYGWLTKEPTARTITVRLDRSYTLGPILALLSTLARRSESIVPGRSPSEGHPGWWASVASRPLRAIGLVAAAVLVSNLAIVIVTRAASDTGVVLRLLFLVPALLAIGVRQPWSVLRESSTLVALFSRR